MHLSTLWLHPAKSLHLVQAALEKEIKDTLASWQQLLARADRIFVQASVSNARPIYGGDDAALQRHDPRIRSIPFNTRSALPEDSRLQALSLYCNVNVYFADLSAIADLIPTSVTDRHESMRCIHNIAFAGHDFSNASAHV